MEMLKYVLPVVVVGEKGVYTGGLLEVPVVERVDHTPNLLFLDITIILTFPL